MRDTDVVQIEVRGRNQLELGLPGKRRRNVVRERRVQRANWWFAKMRQVVDEAIDWQSAPTARAEQGYLTLAGRGN